MTKRTTIVDDAVLSLSEKMIEQSCVLFVGDEISATVQVDGEEYPGLPTKLEMLRRLRESRIYTIESTTFAEALSLKEGTEGRKAIFNFLREQMLLQSRNPLPTHKEIARLPLSALITTNWDSLLEEAFDQLGIPYQIIVDDDDIPLHHSDLLPIIKLYGSLNRSVIFGTEDDLQDFSRNHPLLSSFIRVICAQRTLLFMGYNLEDQDFVRLFRMIKRELGKYTPISYLIHPQPSKFSINYWSKQQQVHVIPVEVFDFLQRLNAQVLLASGRAMGEVVFSESLWMDNPFFPILFQMRSLSTESQIVDGIHAKTLKMLDNTEDLKDIGKLVLQSIEQIAKFRPNYAALSILARNKIVHWFPPYTTTKEEAKFKIEREIQERNQGKNLIGEKGAQVIEPGDKLLLYVYSTRVLASVNAWLSKNARRARELELIIPEARPKSPFPFQNSLEIVQGIENGEVHMILIPDASIANMMEQGKITKVFFGAHKIMQNKNKVFTITNVTGTLLIARLASLYKIPIYVFAEEDKIYPFEIVENFPNLVSTFSMPEEQLMPQKIATYVDLSRMKRLQLLNPGYDDISSADLTFTLITDKRELVLGPDKYNK